MARRAHYSPDHGRLSRKDAGARRGKALKIGDHGHALYRKRKVMIEPVFAQMKFNCRFDRFARRGRSAARSERRRITVTHNLLKLHTHRIALTAA